MVAQNYFCEVITGDDKLFLQWLIMKISSHSRAFLIEIRMLTHVPILKVLLF